MFCRHYSTFLATLLLSIPLAASAAEQHPNVLVFLADDAGWGDYSRSGNSQVQTPQIDSIAERGVSFDRFYVCPVCAPTRAEFLTGRYHLRGGVQGVSTGFERLDIDESTIAQDFQRAGYATGAFGKWHNGSQWPYHPQARGFDEYFGHTSGHWGEYFDAPLEDQGQMVRTKGYIVDVCTDRALQFIEQNHDRPFFCYVPFTTPHSPWAAPAEDWERHKNQPLALLSTRPELEKADETRCALAMLENQDHNVGRILAKLTELQLDENTIIVYFSDNGPNSWRWNGGMKGRKATLDEGGIRSVCYLQWSGKIPAGKVIKPIAGAIDLRPTLTALANVSTVSTDQQADQPLDGLDLQPLLRGETDAWPQRKIYTEWNGKYSVRTDRFRLDDAGKLFDMQNDPGQLNAVNKDQPQVALELEAALKDWRAEMQHELGDAPSSRNRAMDPRPFTVGYREFPITMLPARDGEPHGSVRRSSAAPNCSYFVNWTSTKDSLVWNVAIQTAGQYRVFIDYTCPAADVGSTIELSFGEQRFAGQITESFDPPLYDNQDTLPRPDGESTMKEFRTMDFGLIELPAGTGPLTLAATEIPGASVMDLRRITLVLQPQ